jgi:5,10-methylenetetrahydrofolate reductase
MKLGPTFSFELFPPRTPEGMANLPQVVSELSGARPDFFSITHGAGGSDQNGTYDTLLLLCRWPFCGRERQEAHSRRRSAFRRAHNG